MPTGDIISQRVLFVNTFFEIFSIFLKFIFHVYNVYSAGQNKTAEKYEKSGEIFDFLKKRY